MGALGSLLVLGGWYFTHTLIRSYSEEIWLADPPPEEPFVPDGIIPGYAIAHIRDPNAKVGSPANDIRMLHPGDEVVLVTLGSGGKNPIVDVRLAVRDYFKSGMSDADSSTVIWTGAHT